MHDDIIHLISLGARLFTDIHTASQHHHNSFVNSDNLKVASDLFQIGQKAYKIGADVQRRQYDPIFASRWQYEDGYPFGLSFNQESAVVTLAVERLDGTGFNYYQGIGEIYANSVSMIISGYNYRTGDFVVMRGASNDGYHLVLASWIQGYDIEYVQTTRVSAWAT
jgi:hypothetical protein